MTPCGYCGGQLRPVTQDGIHVLLCFQCSRGFVPLDGELRRNIITDAPRPKPDGVPSRKARHEYTEEDDRLILKLGAEEASDALGLPRASVQNRLRRIRSQRATPEWSELNKARIRLLLDDWCTVREVAEAFGANRFVMRRQLAQMGLLHVPEDYHITETDFQKQVVQKATRRGWQYYHSHDSRRDNAGFPDLVLWRERIIYRELKIGRHQLRPEQRVRLRELRGAGADVDVWRPTDWESKILPSLR